MAADLEVEARVEIGPLVVFSFTQGGVHGHHDPFQGVGFFTGHALGGTARGHDLEALHHGEDLVHRLPGNEAHRGSHVGNVGDQALRLEELQAFPHRDRADFELLSQLVDHEAPARLELAAHDRVPQGPVHELPLRAEAHARHEGGKGGVAQARTTRVFFCTASCAARQARAEPMALSGPQRRGRPTRTAAQNSEIS